MRWTAVLPLLLLAGCPAPRPPARHPVPEPVPEPEVRVGTWNIKRLGHGETRLDLVAEVVSTLDVVAVQEVMNAEGVRLLLDELPGWEAAIAEKPVGRNGYEELYAILYRKDAVSLTRSFTVEDPDDLFAREPFVACFRAHRFDFCVVTIHVTFGGKVQPRDEEIERLGLVAEDLRSETAEGGVERDILVMGDFNRPDGASGFDWLHDAGWRCVLDPAATPTSIGKKGYASAYDHILIDRAHTTEWTGRAARIDLVATVCKDDPAWCIDYVSDHAPVWTSFVSSRPDDD
jgi:endonuclease/exonuclease/phosphatase family metal-dependent hydrolase